MNQPKENGERRVGKHGEELSEREQKQSESLLKLERLCLYYSTTCLQLSTQITKPVWWLARFACADIGAVQMLDRSCQGGTWQEGLIKKKQQKQVALLHQSRTTRP